MRLPPLCNPDSGFNSQRDIRLSFFFIFKFTDNFEFSFPSFSSSFPSLLFLSTPISIVSIIVSFVCFLFSASLSSISSDDVIFFISLSSNASNVVETVVGFPSSSFSKSPRSITSSSSCSFALTFTTFIFIFFSNFCLYFSKTLAFASAFSSDSSAIYLPSTCLKIHCTSSSFFSSKGPCPAFFPLSFSSSSSASYNISASNLSIANSKYRRFVAFSRNFCSRL